MKFIFWQNVLSIHQSAFLRNLSIDNEVFLVAETDIENTRKSQGWTIPDFGAVKIITVPSDENINELLELNNCAHIFTGIDSFPLPSKVFKLAVEKKLKIGVMLEPFIWIGWKGKLRFLKYYMLRLKYQNKIDFILAIGDRGRWCYEKVGFSKNKIFDWAYFTENNLPDDNIDKSFHLLPKILFVGSIDANKNIIQSLKIVRNYLSYIDKFEIVGVGPLERELILLTDHKIIYRGKFNNSEISTIMSQADLLILPSIYDGWGAVVNEALMVGTPVLASDNCGASVLVNENRGKLFSITKNNFEEKFLETLNDLKFGKFSRKEIKDWSSKNIGGESAAIYFESIINTVYADKRRSNTPWLNN